MSLLFLYAIKNPLMSGHGYSSLRNNRSRSDSRPFSSIDVRRILEFFKFFVPELSALAWFIENFRDQHTSRGTTINSFCTDTARLIVSHGANWFEHLYFSITGVERIRTVLGAISSRYTSDIINIAYNWSSTPQGHEYWYQINTMLSAYLDLANSLPVPASFRDTNDIARYAQTIASRRRRLMDNFIAPERPQQQTVSDVNGILDQLAQEVRGAAEERTRRNRRAPRIEHRVDGDYYINTDGDEIRITMPEVHPVQPTTVSSSTWFTISDSFDVNSH